MIPKVHPSTPRKGFEIKKKLLNWSGKFQPQLQHHVTKKQEEDDFEEDEAEARISFA